MEEESVTEIWGIDGFSVETVETTEDALLDRSRRERWPFDAEAAGSIGFAMFCDCCSKASSGTGDIARRRCGSICATSMKSSIMTVLDFPFSRKEEVGAERPLIWGADVESAESVERERLTSICESEGVFD